MNKQAARRGSLMKNFYTAKEAQERLGIDNNGFHYLVRKGTIKGVTLPGKKYKVYPRTEIDRFAATLKTAIEQYERESSVFEPATIDDLIAEYQIDMSIFGKRGTTALDARIDRLQKIPEGNFVLKNDGDIVGYGCYYPLEHGVITGLFDASYKGTIPVEKFLPFKPGMPLEVFIFVVAVKPGFPPDVEKHYGLRLIAGIVEHFRRLGERGVVIENIFARSWTQAGIKLCRKLGMNGEEYQDEPGRWRFSLNIPTSDSLLVQEYKQAYAEYLRSQAEDQTLN
jgi:hypothetical protein